MEFLLLGHSQGMSYEDMALMTGHTAKSVRKKLTALGIYKMNYVTEEEIEFCRQNLGKMSVREMGERLGRSGETLRAYLSRLKISVREATHEPWTLFLTQTEQAAYVLGYWTADGSMTHNAKGYAVHFSCKDKEHLPKIVEATRYSNYHLIHDGRRDHWSLTYGHKEVYRAFQQMGGEQRKSTKERFLWPLNNTFVRHYIRGFCDGDGSLYFLRKQGQPGIGFISSREFIEDLRNFFQFVLGIPPVTISDCHPSYNIRLLCYQSLHAVLIARYLYQGATLFLDRKMALAKQFWDWRPPCWIKQEVTDKMWQVFGDYLQQWKPYLKFA